MQTDESLGLRGKYSVCTRYFLQFSVEVHPEFIQCISDFQKLCVSKMASCTTKLIKSLGLGLSIHAVHSGYLDSSVVKTGPRSFSAFPILTIFIPQTPGRRAKLMKV